MSVISPNETARTWRTQRRENSVQLYLSGAEGDAAALMGARVAGFPLVLNLLPMTDWIDPEALGGAAAAVIQVDADTPASIKRFEKLAASTDTKIIAAAYDPPLALVRALVRAGAHDVIPLPLEIADLETSLAPVRDELAKTELAAIASTTNLVSAIKSVGGVGATAVISQLAIRFAESEARLWPRSLPDRPRRAIRRRRLPARTAAAGCRSWTCSTPARGSTGCCCARSRPSIRAGFT